jgi:hypothetical protein
MKQRVLKAERVGSLVSELSPRGTVASVYGKAVNILMEEGLLLSLVSSLDQMSALSIHLPALFQDGSAPAVRDGFHLHEGAAVCLRETCLIIQRSIIDFSGARPWRGEVVVPKHGAFTVHRIELLEEALLSCGRKGGLLGLLAPAVNDNPYAAKASGVLSLCGLVGLGPGFTPSGDDFLCGVLLGERILCTAPEPLQIPTGRCGRTPKLCLEKTKLHEQLDRTTCGGRTLLWQALRGRFPFYLLEALRGISVCRGVAEMRHAVGRAAAHGETSGTDALIGLLWFFQYVIGPDGVFLSFDSRP